MQATTKTKTGSGRAVPEAERTVPGAGRSGTGRRLVAAVAALGFAAAVSGCAGGVGADGIGGKSAFERGLESRGLEIPRLIPLRDFHRKCRDLGVTHPDGYLESVGVAVRGSGDSRWVDGRELLRACGPECDPGEGLGIILSKFIRLRIDN